MVAETETRRAELYALLGELPERTRPIAVTRLAEVECRGYVLETLVLDLNGIEHVPAIFTRPLGSPPPGRWCCTTTRTAVTTSSGRTS